MCVRTLIPTEQEESIGPVNPANDEQHHKVHPHQLQHQAKLTKTKEKYMKIHDKIIEHDLEIIAQRKAEEDYLVSAISGDILATSTVKYSAVVDLSSRYFAAFQRSKFYKILFFTTQPAHVITIAAVLCVTSALVPSSERIQVAGHPHSRTTSFIYLASFVMHFGAQIWMTFVSGLSLYFALPRHAFGEVQRVLFPRYFTINACLSLITLLIFVKHHPANTWDTEIAIQIGGMSSTFFLELLIRLYLTPSLLELMLQKNTMERAAGVGNEIGRQNPGSLKYCPHYMKIHCAFRRVHVIIAMGNMLSMACTVLHLHYIASKLCV